MELPLGVLATLGITLQEWNVLNMFAPQYLESTLGDGDLSLEVKVIMLKVILLNQVILVIVLIFCLTIIATLGIKCLIGLFTITFYLDINFAY